jgi:hypothetical protein
MSIPLFVSERSEPERTRDRCPRAALSLSGWIRLTLRPFEVLSRMPDATVQIIGRGRAGA